jgi:hypothetical protein
MEFGIDVYGVWYRYRSKIASQLIVLYKVAREIGVTILEKYDKYKKRAFFSKGTQRGNLE